jgi:hypothetical protein
MLQIVSDSLQLGLKMKKSWEECSVAVRLGCTSYGVIEELEING